MKVAAFQTVLPARFFSIKNKVCSFVAVVIVIVVIRLIRSLKMLTLHYCLRNKVHNFLQVPVVAPNFWDCQKQTDMKKTQMPGSWTFLLRYILLLSFHFRTDSPVHEIFSVGFDDTKARSCQLLNEIIKYAYCYQVILFHYIRKKNRIN